MGATSLRMAPNASRTRELGRGGLGGRVVRVGGEPSAGGAEGYPKSGRPWARAARRVLQERRERWVRGLEDRWHVRTSGKFMVAGVALAVGAVIAVAPGTAGALSCASPGAYVPKAGSVDVPTDTLLWGFPASLTRLLGPSGLELPLEERSFAVSGPAVIDGQPVIVPVLIPRAALEPGTAYTIEVRYGPEEVQFIEFETGEGAASAPPALPVLVSSEPRMSLGWEVQPSRWLELRFEHDHILVGDVGGLGPFVSVKDLFTEERAAAQTASGERRTFTWITSGDELAVGRGDCISWPTGADTQSARFGVLDLAGNFSGWVDVPLELPSEAEAWAVLGLDPAGGPQSPPVERAGPSACSLAAVGAPVPRGTGFFTLLALGVGLALTGARRARR
jgi:hypothetical protein